MRVLLLVGLACALLRSDPAPAPASPKLAKITASLKKVQTGLSSLTSPPAGLAGLMSDIDSTLVKLASTAVSETEKMVSANTVMAAIGEFKAMLTKRQDELQAETEAANAFKQRADSGDGTLEEDLFKSLLNVQDLPVEEQQKVLKDAKYAKLAIVATVENSTAVDGDTLAVRMGTALDVREAAERQALSHPRAPVSKAEKLATIAKALQARETRIEEELSAGEAKETKREKQVEDSAKYEQKLGVGASKGMGEATAALKFFNREAKHAFLKKEATLKKEDMALKTAVAAIAKGDIAKISASLDMLKTMGPGPEPIA